MTEVGKVRPLKTATPHRIYAEVLEEEALRQFEEALEQPFVVRGALMPDAHAGYSLPIGGVVETAGVVVPAWVGYDIGCGMCALPTSWEPARVRAEARGLFERIYERVPVGFAHHRAPVAWPGVQVLNRSLDLEAILTREGREGLKQIGTLGGGNHFIEVGEGDDGRVWVVIHSGSRGVGHATATHYMRLASPDGRAREGHFGFDVESPEGRSYVMDMQFCLEFALANRREMMRVVEEVLGELCGPGAGDWLDLINRNHNHAQERSPGRWIHRKGATHAERGMLGVIPGNMRDGSFVVRGQGCEEALYSSSHGAGRVLGRKEAKRTLSLGDFENTMKEARVVARVEAETLDEAPLAYKDIEEVMRQQGDLVEVVTRIWPMVNIKG